MLKLLRFSVIGQIPKTTLSASVLSAPILVNNEAVIEQLDCPVVSLFTVLALSLLI